MNPIDRPHWSFSALSQYLRCPRQYFFERVLCLPRRSCSAGLALGTAVHAALATYHEGLRRCRPLPPGRIRKVLLESWSDRERQEAIVYRDGEDRDGSLARGIALLDAYLREPPPTDILAVEQPLIAPLPDGRGGYLEKPLVAVPDLIVRDRAGPRVVEFKASSRSLAASEAETSLQATCYLHAARSAYGEPTRFEFAVLLKTKVPRIQRIAAARTEADSGRLGDLVASVERAIAAEAFHPIESPLNCTSCPFRRPCREWGTDPTDQSPIGGGFHECEATRLVPGRAGQARPHQARAEDGRYPPRDHREAAVLGPP
jgi:CRISPR/Cas system-associated exonuclease Cas4 (RecB family)